MITLKIVGIEKLRDALKKFPTIATRNINTAIRKTLTSIERDARQNAPKDQGGLKANWRVEIGTLKGSLESGQDYALYVHDGTRPHMPPISAVTPWANRHGIPPFLVARSIARHGTKANPFLYKALESNLKYAEQQFTDAINKTINEI
jgi:HK97 gp10 family phage protein